VAKDPGPSYGAWVEEGRMYARRLDSNTWALGRWLIRGEILQFDVKYQQSMKITGYSRGYLYQAAQVARAFEEHEVCPNLSWAVHREVMREYDLEKRKELFALAQAGRWTTDKVQAHLLKNPPTPRVIGQKRSNIRKPRHDITCPNCGHVFPKHKPRLALVKEKAS